MNDISRRTMLTATAASAFDVSAANAQGDGQVLQPQWPGHGGTDSYAMGHYVANAGDRPLRFLEMFKSSRYTDLSLNQGLALTPPELVQAHLELDPKSIERALQRVEHPIVPV